MEEAKEMKCCKRLKCKRFVQISGLCSPQFLIMSYLPKRFMHLCRALYGDATLVHRFGPPISPPKSTTTSPGIVNRTFENRTQSNEIEHHTFSEFDFRTNRIQLNKSNSIELNPSDCVGLSSETELNRTQLNGFRSIGSGEPEPSSIAELNRTQSTD